MRDHRLASRRVIAAAALAAAVLQATAASAVFSSPSAAEMTISSATLAAPPALSAVRGTCVPVVSRNVDLSWTASSSSFTTGYEVLRGTASGGPYSSIATIGPTTTYTDATVAAATTYFYVVRAMKINWRSATSPQASVTTPNSICL